MSVIVLPRRLLHILLKLTTRKATLHTKFKLKTQPKPPKEDHTNLTLLQTSIQRAQSSNAAVPRCFRTDTSKKLQLNPLKKAQFSNTALNRLSASTYESLVNQKCSNSGKSKSLGRHQFHKEVEDALNDQISAEFNASYAYLSMACYFGKTEVALPGCQGFFMDMHKEEHEHAIIFLNYILMRGGQVKVPNICACDDDWKDISRTFSVAAEMEASVKEKLQNVIQVGEKHKDYQVVDFITNSFMKEQNESICTMARLHARSKMVNSEIGEYLFDQHLYESFVKRSKDNLMYLKDLPDGEGENVYK